MLTERQAEEVAALLNARNELMVPYTPQKILASADDYLVRLSDSGSIAAFVEVKKVQWYQAEILHLTVHPNHENMGHAKALLDSAERKARNIGARVVQCTIRENNARSRGLFVSRGFTQVNSFLNAGTGNRILVFQKVLT